MEQWRGNVYKYNHTQPWHLFLPDYEMDGLLNGMHKIKHCYPALSCHTQASAFIAFHLSYQFVLLFDVFCTSMKPDAFSVNRCENWAIGRSSWAVCYHCAGLWLVKEMGGNLLSTHCMHVPCNLSICYPIAFHTTVSQWYICSLNQPHPARLWL